MFKKITAILLTLATLPVCAAEAKEQMKGVWVPTIYGLDYPQKATTNADALMADADSILNNCRDLGFNAIFLQVRPDGDALYNSALFPYSRWLTGTQGLAPGYGFDPLKYWVEGAHRRGMELHAWINPYRAYLATESLDMLAETNPARQHPEYVLQYRDGSCLYNPALPEVRKLLTDCVLEIADNYDIDGIHMDDYFYPGTDIDDAEYFERYGAGFADIGDWRRNNVDMLIKGLHDELSARDVTFGIAPPGIWANSSHNPLGSDTGGYESYYTSFADTRKWALEAWVDYIAPQIYWEIGNSVADYSKVLSWWQKTLAGSGTRLYAGLADYRCNDAAAGSPWYMGGAIRAQLELNDSCGVDGAIHYRYSSIISQPELYEIVKEHNRQHTGISVYLNGNEIEFDQPPIIRNDRTLVPMRAVFEAFGMNVEWDGAARRVTSTNNSGRTIIMTIDDPVMYIDGKELVLDVPPQIVSDRTLVPIRAIAESLGLTVDWDGDNMAVYIY